MPHRLRHGRPELRGCARGLRQDVLNAGRRAGVDGEGNQTQLDAAPFDPFQHLVQQSRMVRADHRDPQAPSGRPRRRDRTQSTQQRRHSRPGGG